MLFAVYWRTILATVLLIVTFSFVQQQINILAIAGNINYFPTLFWCFIAFVFFVFTIFLSNGLVFFLWGSALNLNNSFWRKFNISTVIFFIALSLLALVVHSSFDNDIWAYYKLFGQPSMLLIIPLLYIKKILSITIN
ncbi:MAG: intracellular septation protein A [Paraglaciecola sp.]|jgi:intracellular septation protein A